jgi:hypothetical protein
VARRPMAWTRLPSTRRFERFWTSLAIHSKFSGIRQQLEWKCRRWK